ncbi:MAG: alcohol dehydrogenase catalytic domain-containing protein, partial [Defluviitaleaceae bacterium]|nr:alcohol dehydrogenase catalytic domain-containing protein [Defluviitaleaceae bacterium]
MSDKMLAARVYGMDDLRVEHCDKPACPEGSILVRVMACSICGTDVRIYRKGDYRAQYPVIIGHEIAGEIAEVAPGVKGYNIGDRVCVAPGHGCGHCRTCQKGYPNVCTNPHPSLGYKLNGGFAEYIAVPEHILRLGFVNKIPDGLSYNQAALSEITACCLNAQANICVQPGDTVLIMGCGPAGIIHAHLSKHFGAGRVIVTQRSSGRLERAKAMFPDVIDRTISSDEEDLNSEIMKETNGDGADVVIVCAPSREAQEKAATLVAPRGRVNFFGGLPKDDCIDKIDANVLHYKEYFISGASSSLPENNREALRL